MPPAHRNLAAVEFALVFETSLLSLLACRLASITPAEVVELPECVRRKNKIPDRQRQQVDEHPRDIRPAVSCDDDENGGKTENQGKQNQRNEWRCSMQNSGLDRDGD